MGVLLLSGVANLFTRLHALVPQFLQGRSALPAAMELLVESAIIDCNPARLNTGSWTIPFPTFVQILGSRSGIAGAEVGFGRKDDSKRPINTTHSSCFSFFWGVYILSRLYNCPFVQECENRPSAAKDAEFSWTILRNRIVHFRPFVQIGYLLVTSGSLMRRSAPLFLVGSFSPVKMRPYRLHHRVNIRCVSWS